MVRKYFTLVAALFVAALAVGQTNLQFPGQGGNYGSPSAKAGIWGPAFGNGNQFSPGASPHGMGGLGDFDNQGLPPSGGSGPSVQTMFQGAEALLSVLPGIWRGNAWGNVTHANEGHLAGLQYFMASPAGVETEGLTALSSGIQFGKDDLLMGPSAWPDLYGLLKFDVDLQFQQAGGGAGRVLGRGAENLRYSDRLFPINGDTASEALNMPAGARIRFHMPWDMNPDVLLDKNIARAAGLEGMQAYAGHTGYDLRLIRAGYGSFFNNSNVSFYRSIPSSKGLQLLEVPPPFPH